MTIIINGHKHKYEVENICKLFIPCVSFNFVYDSEIWDKEKNYLYTRVTSDNTGTSVTVSTRVGKKFLSDTQTLNPNAANPERECEYTMSVMIYKMFSQLFGISPKWGILTGIRPVANIQHMKAKGMDDAQLRAYFTQHEMVSREKFDLALKIAQNQKSILASAQQDQYSLYIGIPFCPTRCSYCSFVSNAVNTKKVKDMIEPYVNLLVKELELTAQVAKECGLKLRTVYIGGGTPTTLEPAQLKLLTQTVDRLFLAENRVDEYTVEAGRPDTITEEKLKILYDAGVGRISINPQTFSDSVLEAIGRKHTAKQAVDCYELARKIGFDNINMDFIAGLPTDTEENFRKTIDRAVSLSPSNITVHTLSIKKSAKLYADDEYRVIGRESPVSGMVDYAVDTLCSNEYHPYYLYKQKNTLDNLENIGYAKQGCFSLYNIFIMEEVQSIIAAGAGGVTKLVDRENNRIERVFNYKYPFEYFERFDNVLQRKRDIVSLLSK